jgi:hypothetical protein
MLQGRSLLITKDVVMLNAEEGAILKLLDFLRPIARMGHWLRMLLKGLMEMNKRTSNTLTGRGRRFPGIIRFLKVTSGGVKVTDMVFF